jgi:hypothetical protein
VHGGGPTDGFVTKINPAGAGLVYSTYLGGTGGEYGRAIALDVGRSAYVTGATNSTDYPTTTGAPQTTNAGTVDSFVTKLTSNGSGVGYSTYVGGSSDDNVAGIAVDALGRASIVGNTLSTNYPTTADALKATKSAGDNDIFVTTLSSTGGALAFSTYMGGPLDDLGYGVALDPAGTIYLTGATLSTDYPTTPGAFRIASQGGYEGVVTKLSVFAPLVPATNVAAGATLAVLLVLSGAWLARARRAARG